MYCEKQTTMDKNEQTKACSARACSTSDGRKKTQEPISSPNDRFLSGGNIGTVVAGSLIGGVVGSMAGEKGVDVMWDTFGK